MKHTGPARMRAGTPPQPVYCAPCHIDQDGTVTFGGCLMSTQYNRFSMPDPLDPAFLDPAVYHVVVGPALQVAAEVAAKRGDPTLHADMPAMLALIDLITHLAYLYTQTYPERPTDRAKLDEASAAACVMVLQEAEMEPFAIEQCLQALQAAYKQLYEHEVVEQARPFIAHAWEHLVDDQREQARACLTMAANTIIAAIENWREQVENVH